jgi:lysophospholipase L1-like esterase
VNGPMNTIAIAFLVISALSAPVFAETKYTYLALGDSVPFGMNVTLLPPYSERTPVPAEFIGYPEAVAAQVHVSELNASCPGETSGSFLNTSVLDNGCNSPHVVPLPSPALPPVIIPPFKTTIGLHAAYTVAQMDFAVSQLKVNKGIDLVTLSIGANDALLVLPQLQQCGGDPICAQNVLGPVLQTYGANLVQILAGIRAEYQGTLILTTYYSPAPALDGVALAINGVMTQVAAQLSATPGFAPITIADGFGAFQNASAPFGHDACQAGLLIQLPPSPYDLSQCDIHPSPLGRDLLAGLVELAAPPTGKDCDGTYNGTFVGNLKVSAGQTCMLVGGGVTGNITQTGGTLVLSGTTVGGSVQVHGGGTFSISGSARIVGNLQIQNLPASPAQNQVCGLNVLGNLMYQNSNAPVEIGAATMCPGNTVGGNLQVGNNAGAVGISGNIVTGNLQVQNDTGSTTVFSNNVAQNLQCSGNTTITGSGNTASQKKGQCAAF